MIVTPGELEMIQQHAIREYPNEACGVILARGTRRRLLRLRNVQDELHAKDPKEYPITAREGYSVSVQDRRLLAELGDFGVALKVIYHSHVDAQWRGGGTGAYFSDTDKKNAVLLGEPTYPRTTYVVVSVVKREIEAVAGFRWDARQRDFTKVDLEQQTWQERTAELAGRTWGWLGQMATRAQRLG